MSWRGGAKQRRDEAEPKVIEAFEANGATVRQVNGYGAPDLIVGYLQRTHLVEVKTGKAKLRDSQVEWQKDWNGEPVAVARGPEDVVRLLTEWKVSEAVEARRKEIA